MHRRRQFDMRENPASDRRHGSRPAATSKESSSDSKGQNQSQASSSAVIVASNAANYAATGERSKTAEQSSITPGPFHGIGRSFEPLIGSIEAAGLLGNIHVKTLQRYARLGAIPGYQIGGHWYFRTSDLDDWLQTQINSKSPTR